MGQCTKDHVEPIHTESHCEYIVLSQSDVQPYRLGLPAWAFPGWRDRYFSPEPSLLASYASVFNAVEGNTTFYHIPTDEKVRRWAEALQGSDCKISFKLPSALTHERRPDAAILNDFLTTLQPLKPQLGPFLLQFPEWAGVDFLQRFAPLFEQVAAFGNGVVEVRNRALFAQPELLEPLLEQFGFGRVMLDSRPLYHGNPDHPAVKAAIHEKPDVPVLETIYNNLAFVRLILHPDTASNAVWMDYWVQRTAQWIADGIEPVIMIHCPDNAFCPVFAEMFHQRLAACCRQPLPALPPWPVPQQGQLL